MVLFLQSSRKKENKSKKGIPRLLELVMIKKAPMVATIVFTVLATIVSFVPYLTIYFVISEIIKVYPDFGDLETNKTISYGVLAIAGVLANIILSVVASIFSHIATYGTLYELKFKFLSHITKLPLGFDLNIGSGKIRKIMDDNIESLEGFIAHDFSNMLSALLHL